jgi:phospholipase C
MAQTSAYLLLAALVVSSSTFTAWAEVAETQKIKHVIVLVMENRAFDHMVGFMKAENPEINGCLPGMKGCSNPNDPALATDQQVWTDISSDCAYHTVVDPNHEISATTYQIYPLGENTTSADKLMTGFISNYRERGSSEPESIMKAFAPEHVPIVSQLAREFMLVDGWFAGVPGPTWPNRCYVVAATSHGMGTNDVAMLIKGLL